MSVQSTSARQKPLSTDGRQIIIASRDGDSRALARLLKARRDTKPPYFFSLALACAAEGGHLRAVRLLLAHLGPHARSLARESVFNIAFLLQDTEFGDASDKLFNDFHAVLGLSYSEDANMNNLAKCNYGPLVLAVANLRLQVVKELFKVLNIQAQELARVQPEEKISDLRKLFYVLFFAENDAGTNVATVRRMGMILAAELSVDVLEIFMSEPTLPKFFMLEMLLNIGYAARDEYVFTVMNGFPTEISVTDIQPLTRMLILLFRKGASPNATDSRGTPAVFMAAKFNWEVILDVFFGFGADPRAFDPVSKSNLLEFILNNDLFDLVPRMFELLDSNADQAQCLFAIEDTVRNQLESDLRDGRHKEVRTELWSTSVWTSSLYPIIANSFKKFKHLDDQGKKINSLLWWKNALKQAADNVTRPASSHYSSCSRVLYKECHSARVSSPGDEFSKFARQHLAALANYDSREWMLAALNGSYAFAALAYRTMRASAYRFIGVVKEPYLACYRGDWLSLPSSKILKLKPGDSIEEITGPTSVALGEDIAEVFANQYDRSIVYRVLVPNTTPLTPVMFCSAIARQHEFIIFERGHFRLLAVPERQQSAESAERWIAHVEFVRTGILPKDLPKTLEII